MTGVSFLNIDFLISIVLTIALLSTVVSWMVEWYQGWINARGKMLYNALADALKHENADHPNYTALLYQHPLIDMLKARTDRSPSYIAPEVFSQALIQVISSPIKDVIFEQDPETKGIMIKESPQSETYQRLTHSVNSLSPSYLRTLLDSFIEHSHDLASLEQVIAQWYSSYMERITGWYKRKVRLKLFIGALLLCAGFNINLFSVVDYYYHQPQNQALAVGIAEKLTVKYDSLVQQNGSDDTIHRQILDAQEAMDYLNQLQTLPIGWSPGQRTTTNPWQNMIGILLMATLICFGAPFWFDVLSKLVNMRSTGIKSLLSKETNGKL